VIPPKLNVCEIWLKEGTRASKHEVERAYVCERTSKGMMAYTPASQRR